MVAVVGFDSENLHFVAVVFAAGIRHVDALAVVERFVVVVRFAVYHQAFA